ncbi:hypothetical protein RM704_10685 [Streptomyces sp. DSM 3412]|uniref:DUF3618 domain-containing protein n=1 Tax=Streptomyces gottesmaniae TaxID=3075518 RepID=A0ABU2YUJ7_9ACTN|nr:hypothetical protein [Streptomyces sp. DSM 3412]MDT0567931.1 hypothetical protein [Streptomyces sp. DSM 3412]
MTVPEASVAVELERLRGTVATGFAEVKGSLAVLVERSDRNERDLQQLRQDTEKDIGDLRADVEALKKGRWPLPTMAALAGAVGAGTGLFALLAR